MASEPDARPFAEPDCFTYREPAECDYRSFVEYCREQWSDCQWGRFTAVFPGHPMPPPYPEGWYFEGWTVDPAKMDPPHRQAPFNFPLTATLNGGTDGE